MIQAARLIWMSLIILVPLTLRTPTSGLAGTGRLASYLWTDGLLAVVALLILANDLVGRRGRREADRGLRLELLFILLFEIQYVSLLVALLRGDPMSGSYLGAGSVWLRALVVFMAARRLVRGGRDVERIRVTVLWAHALVCTIALLELMGVPVVTGLLNAYYGTPIHREAALHLAALGQYRVTATFDRNPHGLALFMLIGITMACAGLLDRPAPPAGRRIVLVTLLAAGVVVLLVTNSLAGLVGTVAAVASVLMTRRPGRLRGALVLGIVLVAVGVGAAVRLRTALPRFATAALALRGGDLSSVALLSLTDRLAAWDQVLTVMRNTPLAPVFGVGPAVLVEAVSVAGIYADNDYLFVLFSTGLLGLAAFVLLLAAGVARLQRAMRRAREGKQTGVALLVATRGVLAGFAVAALAGPFFTGDAFWRDSYMLWTLLGVACAPSTLRGGDTGPKAELEGQVHDGADTGAPERPIT